MTKPPTAGWYVVEPDRYVGPFADEREALYYFGFAHGTHGGHREMVQEMDDDLIAYALSGDGLPRPARFARPRPALLNGTRKLIAMEEAA